MKRRRFIALLGVTTLTWPRVGKSQGVRVYRIGFLFAGTLSLRPQAREFWRTLQKLGYEEGRNLIIETREANENVELLPGLALELVAKKPDLIVAVTPPAVAAVQRATQIIPVVMAVVPDPVALGFVKSLSHPGGNITGPSASIYIGGYLGGLTAKRMQLIKELIPAVRVLGILWNEGALSNTIVFKSANEIASSFALSIKSFSLRNPADLNETLSNLSKEHPDAVLVLGDPLFFDRRKDIIRFSIEHQIPTFHVWPEEAVDGAFAAYGSRLSDDYGRAAHYVDRILKGAMPNDLPVEQPTKFDLVINVKTAKALGLTIPESFLLRADEVIE